MAGGIPAGVGGIWVVIRFCSLVFSLKTSEQNFITTHIPPTRAGIPPAILDCDFSPTICDDFSPPATTATCAADMSCDFPSGYQSPNTAWPSQYQGEQGNVPYKIKLDTIGVYKDNPTRTASDIAKPIKCVIADAKESIMKIVSAE